MITDRNGEKVKERTYEAFGNIVDVSGSLSDNREFTGKEKDETGLHYFGARFYNGDWGRFMSPDPHSLNPSNLDLTDPQSLNPYTYCMNSPLQFYDPDGGTGHSKSCSALAYVYARKDREYYGGYFTKNGKIRRI